MKLSQKHSSGLPLIYTTKRRFPQEQDGVLVPLQTIEVCVSHSIAPLIQTYTVQSRTKSLTAIYTVRRDTHHWLLIYVEPDESFGIVSRQSKLYAETCEDDAKIMGQVMSAMDEFFNCSGLGDEVLLA